MKNLSTCPQFDNSIPAYIAGVNLLPDGANTDPFASFPPEYKQWLIGAQDFSVYGRNLIPPGCQGQSASNPLASCVCRCNEFLYNGMQTNMAAIVGALGTANGHGPELILLPRYIPSYISMGELTNIGTNVIHITTRHRLYPGWYYQIHWMDNGVQKHRTMLCTGIYTSGGHTQSDNLFQMAENDKTIAYTNVESSLPTYPYEIMTVQCGIRRGKVDYLRISVAVTEFIRALTPVIFQSIYAQIPHGYGPQYEAIRLMDLKDVRYSDKTLTLDGGWTWIKDRCGTTDAPDRNTDENVLEYFSNWMVIGSISYAAQQISITIGGTANSGNYYLIYNGTQIGPFNQTTTDAQMQTAIRTVSGLSQVTVVRTGTTPHWTYVLTMLGFDDEQTITNNLNTFNGTVTITTTRHIISLDDTTISTVKSNVINAWESYYLVYNSSNVFTGTSTSTSADMQSALRTALSNTSITVTKYGDTFVISWGTFIKTHVLSADTSGMTAGSVVVVDAIHTWATNKTLPVDHDGLITISWGGDNMGCRSGHLFSDIGADSSNPDISKIRSMFTCGNGFGAAGPFPHPLATAISIEVYWSIPIHHWAEDDTQCTYFDKNNNGVIEHYTNWGNIISKNPYYNQYVHDDFEQRILHTGTVTSHDYHNITINMDDYSPLQGDEIQIGWKTYDTPVTQTQIFVVRVAGNCAFKLHFNADDADHFGCTFGGSSENYNSAATVQAQLRTASTERGVCNIGVTVDMVQSDQNIPGGDPYHNVYTYTVYWNAIAPAFTIIPADGNTPSDPLLYKCDCTVEAPIGNYTPMDITGYSSSGIINAFPNTRCWLMCGPSTGSGNTITCSDWLPGMLDVDPSGNQTLVPPPGAKVYVINHGCAGLPPVGNGWCDRGDSSYDLHDITMDSTYTELHNAKRELVIKGTGQAIYIPERMVQIDAVIAMPSHGGGQGIVFSNGIVSRGETVLADYRSDIRAPTNYSHANPWGPRPPGILGYAHRTQGNHYTACTWQEIDDPNYFVVEEQFNNEWKYTPRAIATSGIVQSGVLIGSNSGEFRLQRLTITDSVGGVLTDSQYLPKSHAVDNKLFYDGIVEKTRFEIYPTSEEQWQIHKIIITGDANAGSYDLLWNGHAMGQTFHQYTTAAEMQGVFRAINGFEDVLITAVNDPNTANPTYMIYWINVAANTILTFLGTGDWNGVVTITSLQPHQAASLVGLLMPTTGTFNMNYRGQVATFSYDVSAATLSSGLNNLSLMIADGGCTVTSGRANYTTGGTVFPYGWMQIDMKKTGMSCPAISDYYFDHGIFRIDYPGHCLTCSHYCDKCFRGIPNACWYMTITGATRIDTNHVNPNANFSLGLNGWGAGQGCVWYLGVTAEECCHSGAPWSGATISLLWSAVWGYYYQLDIGRGAQDLFKDSWPIGESKPVCTNQHIIFSAMGSNTWVTNHAYGVGDMIHYVPGYGPSIWMRCMKAHTSTGVNFLDAAAEGQPHSEYEYWNGMVRDTSWLGASITIDSGGQPNPMGGEEIITCNQVVFEDARCGHCPNGHATEVIKLYLYEQQYDCSGPGDPVPTGPPTHGGPLYLTQGTSTGYTPTGSDCSCTWYLSQVDPENPALGGLEVFIDADQTRGNTINGLMVSTPVSICQKGGHIWDAANCKMLWFTFAWCEAGECTDEPDATPPVYGG